MRRRNSEIRRLRDRYAFSYRSKIDSFFFSCTQIIQIPRTLDNTREADETIVTPEDEEVLADETMDEFSDYFLRGKIPNIMVTTRPKPSTKLYDFVKELMTMIPNISYYARRHYNIKEICKLASERGFTHLIVRVCVQTL